MHALPLGLENQKIKLPLLSGLVCGLADMMMVRRWRSGPAQFSGIDQSVRQRERLGWHLRAGASDSVQNFSTLGRAAIIRTHDQSQRVVP